jgi:hypothetical protein
MFQEDGGSSFLENVGIYLPNLALSPEGSNLNISAMRTINLTQLHKINMLSKKPVSIMPSISHAYHFFFSEIQFQFWSGLHLRCHI